MCISFPDDNNYWIFLIKSRCLCVCVCVYCSLTSVSFHGIFRPVQSLLNRIVQIPSTLWWISLFLTHKYNEYILHFSSHSAPMFHSNPLSIRHWFNLILGFEVRAVLAVVYCRGTYRLCLRALWIKAPVIFYKLLLIAYSSYAKILHEVINVCFPCQRLNFNMRDCERWLLCWICRFLFIALICHFVSHLRFA